MDYTEGYVRVEREERKDEKKKEGWEFGMTELRKGICRENQSVSLWPRETWRSSSI